MKTMTDYASLVKTGIELISDYSHQTWTDYNIHDPGITILEYLCYTLCELESLCFLPVEDLLAPSETEHLEKETVTQKARRGRDTQILEMPPEIVKEISFYKAEDIIPGRALTFRDYRKLLIDFKGVKNAWIAKTEEKVGPVSLEGIYQAFLVLEDWADEKTKNFILREAREILVENRNLCEDVSDIHILPELDITAHIDLELSAETNPAVALGKAAYLIDQYLSPEITFYSLDEMLQKNLAITDIFSGPVLAHGFISDEELDRLKPIDELYHSEVLKRVLDIEGVVAVDVAELHPLSGDLDYPADIRQSWGLKIPNTYVARFSPKKSKFSYRKSGQYFHMDSDLIIQQFNLLKAQNAPGSFDRKELIPCFSKGKNHGFMKYHSLQNHFPANYGIGLAGLSTTESPLRKSQAKQLKAYLMFFEQLIADHRCQLANVGKLFSFSPKQRTRYVQLIEGLAGMDQLLKKPDGFLQRLEEIVESDEQFLSRRNQFLDHLLARYAEDLSAYENTLSQTHQKDAPRELIATKERILNNYVGLSQNRFAAWNYKAGGSDNRVVSGLENRMRTLFGLDDDGGLEHLYRMFWCLKQTNEVDGLNEYRFYLKDENNKILLSSSRHFYSSIGMESLMQQVCIFGDNRENYRLGEADYGDYAGQYYYQLMDRNGRNIADSGAFYPSRKERDHALEKTLGLMKKYTRESIHMYVVEHILLRPSTTEKTYKGFDYTKKTDEADWQDLYSQQISIFLPDWPELFHNEVFKDFFIRSIREHTPAHIYPHIFWLGRVEMEHLENVLFQWQHDFAKRSEFLDRSLYDLKQYLGKLIK